MNRFIRLSIGALAIALACAVVRADVPQVFAIKGARIVTVAGATIPSGTVVVRNGLIDAVGADVAVPTTATVIDGAGLTVYPGLIDMGNSAGVDVPTQTPPTFRTTAEAERYRRSINFRPDLDAASHVRGDSPDLARYANAGITSVLATPPSGIVKGQSALVNVVSPTVERPQVGNVGDYREGLQIVRTPVALHVDYNGGGGRGGGYPVSLMGVISFVRQGFIDAGYQHAVQQRYAKGAATGAVRPNYDPALTAMQPALEGKLPVAFEANAAREILRALDMAREFKLDPIVTGAGEAHEVAEDLKSRNARVIYNVNYPTRSRTLPPDADEPISVLRARANAPKVPAALQKAGVTFAFSSAGLRDPRDFVRNVARAVREGLPADAAIRALTADAAKIAGAADRLGTIEKGRIANLLVTEGDLFDNAMKVKHVIVDGRMVPIEDAPAPTGGRGGRGGQ
jgi:imidazolonepropionase-like amidohydrolase